MTETTPETTIDPRSLLLSLFPGAPLPQVDAPARAADVLSAATAAQAWFLRLLLPRLASGQRLRLAGAAAQGMPQFLRAYEQIGRTAGFRRALRLSGPDLAALRRIHGQLSRIAVLGQRLGRSGEAGERWALCRLRVALDRLSETAEALCRDDATEPRLRRAAAAFAGTLQDQRVRQKESEAVAQRKASSRLRRAESAQATLLAPVRERELRSALLEGEEDRRPPALSLSPVPLVAARRSGPAPLARTSDALADGPPGAPLDRCLTAPPADYGGCVASLEEQTEALRFPESEAARPDAVRDGDLALLMAPVLFGLPWLEEAAAVSGKDLEELCDLRAACASLQKMAALLFQGARDGLLCAGTMVLEVHGRTQSFLRGAPAAGDGAAEIAELRLLVEGAAARLSEGAERKVEKKASVEGKVAVLAQETAEKLEAADFEQTMAELRAGAEVAAPKLERAAAYKRQRGAGAARPGRRRPR